MSGNRRDLSIVLVNTVIEATILEDFHLLHADFKTSIK